MRESFRGSSIFQRPLQISGRATSLLLAYFAAALIGLFLAGPAPAQKKSPPSEPIDLNAANAKELEQLPGIGPVTAKAIVDFRAKSGPFKRVEDLLVIRGISEAKLKRIRPYLTVKSAPAAKPAPPKPAPKPAPAKPAAKPAPSLATPAKP